MLTLYMKLTYHMNINNMLASKNETFAKFDGDWSSVRGVNGCSKFRNNIFSGATNFSVALLHGSLDK